MESDENCIVQMWNSPCSIVYKDKRYTASSHAIIMLGRLTSVRLECEEKPCEIMVLRYRRTCKSPSLDMNHMCLHISLVDSFLGIKRRFCMLNDKTYIYLTMNSLHYEWNHSDSGRNNMVYHLLYVLFIQLARAFHADKQTTGIRHLAAARSFIQENYQCALTLDEIATHIGISRTYLSILFNNHMNRSVVDYIQAVRCDHAAYLLTTTNFAIIDVAVETGFNNRQHFSRTFKAIYGITPNDYRHMYKITPLKK